jgi:glycine reductase complex component B subunit gamma
MRRKLKAVHYLNQFFGQIGGEDKADTQPLSRAGAVGPGVLFQQILGEEVQIKGTVICGDNTFAEHTEQVTQQVIALIKSHEPDLVLAGPAFNAGRYGIACAAVCEAAAQELGIPSVTGMFPENPAVEMYRKSVYIVSTLGTALGMKDAAENMVRLAMRLARGEVLGTPKEEGYIARGIRKNYFASDSGAVRAVDMLLRKIKREPYETEYPMPVFDRLEPLPPVERLGEATIALVTSGGIVPKGNPDRIESSSASKFGKYDISKLEHLSPESHETAHGGYDPTYANADPHRVLPLDVIRDLEREARIGKLYPYYYATVGNGTSVASARKFAQEIAKDLIRDGVQAVILSST